ncbi:MAG: hypothetical protein E7813_18500 [Bradyrhizobium sp.]|uniref:hypothetical protein n=1 Tax=Bradyrhizobium sp. TaxID=376 RepID=UPI0011F9ED14|nr:hypothetical protein [Bradyrhizobium sp.]THD63415.1 MAG: hypothetical protein E7813_18500 [Bradyrhizobium sp.]
MVDVKNVRVAVVHYEGDRDFAGTGRYLSIRNYQDNGRLMMGPAIPINSQMTDMQIEHLAGLLIKMVCGPDPDEEKTTLAFIGEDA